MSSRRDDSAQREGIDQILCEAISDGKSWT